MTDIAEQTETDGDHRRELSRYDVLLRETDWASLGTPSGTGEALPAALERLLDDDPIVRETGVREALGAVSHQNTIYEATTPVALYVAAILTHPATAVGEHVPGVAPRYPTRAAILDWLSDTAFDADDETVALGRSLCADADLGESAEIRAFRDARPVIYAAIQPLLADGNPEVHAAALVAAIPLSEHPDLTRHRDALAGHARYLLTVSSDRYKRDRILDTLKAWGHDTGELESTDDVRIREMRARRQQDSWAGGTSEDPPF